MVKEAQSSENRRDLMAGKRSVMPMFLILSLHQPLDVDDDYGALLIDQDRVRVMEMALEAYFYENVTSASKRIDAKNRHVKVDVIGCVTPVQSLVDGLPKGLGKRLMRITELSTDKSYREDFDILCGSFAMHMSMAPAEGEGWPVGAYAIPFLLHTSERARKVLKSNDFALFDRGLMSMNEHDGLMALEQELEEQMEMSYQAALVSDWGRLAVAKRFVQEIETSEIAAQALRDGEDALIDAGPMYKILIRQGQVYVPFLSLQQYETVAGAGSPHELAVEYTRWLESHYSITWRLREDGFTVVVVDSPEFFIHTTPEEFSVEDFEILPLVVVCENKGGARNTSGQMEAKAVLRLHGDERRGCIGTFAIYLLDGSLSRAFDFYQTTEIGSEQIKQMARQKAADLRLTYETLGDGHMWISSESPELMAPEYVSGWVDEQDEPMENRLLH